MDTSEGSAHIVGFASWYQHDEFDTALKWHKGTIADSTYRHLIHTFLEADEAVEIQRLQLIITFLQDLVTPDRSAEPSRLKLLQGTDLFESISERWDLCNIAVHPSYQQRGIAGHLTKWGLEIAVRERVPVTLEVTINAEALYRRIELRDYSYNCLAEDIDEPALIWNRRGWTVRMARIFRRGKFCLERRKAGIGNHLMLIKKDKEVPLEASYVLFAFMFLDI